MANTGGIQQWILILLGIYAHFSTAQDYEYLDCYYDFYNARALKDLTDCSDKSSICAASCSTEAPYCESNFMTIDVCKNICRDNNYKYFGLQAGRQCFCGGVFSTESNWVRATSPSDVARCSTPCTGNSNQECGGDYIMRVFKFTGPLASSICYHPGASVVMSTGPFNFNTPVRQQPVSDYFFNAGDTIQYACEQRGHKVIGLSIITCQLYSGVGSWTGPPPDGCTCCAAQCSVPPIPTNALQSGQYNSPYYEGDTVEFLCINTGATYIVMCAATGTGVPGAWTDIGNPCDPTTPVPTTKLRTTRAPITAPRPPAVPPQRCPSFNCGFTCQYGFLQDSLGCSICGCASPPVIPTAAKPTTQTRIVCQQISCNMACPYGLRLDINGCTVCECRIPPGVQLPPVVIQTTPKAQTTKRKITDGHISKKSTILPDTTENITQAQGGLGISVPVLTQSRPSLDTLPFIVGGVAFLGLILLLVFAIFCRQDKFTAKKFKHPPPPPPDYPTIDKRNYHYSVQRREVDLVYDTIELEKRKRNKKKRKNSYIQNDIPNAPPPPTISQNVTSQEPFSNIHSLDRSTVGATQPHHSQSMQSLNRSMGSSGMGTRGSRRPKLHSKSPSPSHTRRARSKSPHGLSLDRSLAGGYPTPNSQTLSMSLPRGTRFIPIDLVDGDLESHYAATIDRSTVNRSVASDPQTLGRSVASDPIRSERDNPSYHNPGTRSYQNTPRSKHKVKKVPQTPNSRVRSKSSRPTTPTTPRSYQGSGHASTPTTPRSYQGSGHVSTPTTPRSSQGSAAVSFHGSVNSVMNSPMLGSHTSMLSGSHQDISRRAKSMYANMPSKDLPMTTSLDRLNMHVDEPLYMEAMEVSTRSRPPQRAVSTEMLSTPSRYQNRMRNIKGPRLHINTKAPTRSSSQQHIPPDSPFGNNVLETATPL